ncbi:MAG: terminase gpA endonuclease subunit, partial [Desulfobacteraceae bacterium]
MDDELKKLLEVADENDKLELKIFWNAFNKTLGEYKESPTKKNKQNLDAARDSLEGKKQEMNQKYFGKDEQANGTPVFSSLLEVLKHLDNAGFRISKSKLYRDKDKAMIRVNPDGSVPETEVRAYASTLERKDGNIDDLSDIHAHKNHLPSGIVPEGSVALTCGIDMQKHGFFFVVRSWKRDLSNHLVQYGWLDSWKDVEQLVFGTRYRIENANEDQTMGIWRAALDTGGGPNDDMEWSRTEEAYHWIRKNSRGVIFGIKGENKRQIKRVNPRVIDKMARGNRPIPGGLVLYFLDTEQFKDLYHFRLSRGPEESQQMTLNSDTGLDYARQILAEEKQKDR